MKKDYYELTIIVSSQHSLYAEFLSDTIPIGFEETNTGFVLRSEDKLDIIIWGLEQFTEALQKALSKPIDLDCVVQKKQNRDWVEEYQQSIKSLEIDKFFVHSTWNEPKEDFINIAIDPALAFRTGHHATTSSALKAISKYVKKNDTLIDVGCGSGILSIGALKLGAKVDACDTDIVAVDNSCTNAELNAVEFSNIWEGSCSLAQLKYDVVVANIVADVLIFIANDIKSILKDDGLLILSGVLEKYENKVLKYYKEFDIVERISKDEWITLILKQEK